MTRLVWVALAAVLVTPAFAADMPVKARMAPPVVASTWSGCYVGANAGWLRTDATLTSTPGGPSVVGFPIALNTHSYDLDSSSFTGGVQAGCNMQTGRWVLGVEADVNWTGAEKSTIVAFPTVGPWLAHTEAPVHKLSWFSTVRARLGIAATDHTLLYATGGLALGRVTSSFNYVAFVAFPIAGQEAETRAGWTVGGGLEHAFGNNWSVKAEYLYLDLGSFAYQAMPPVFTGEIYTIDVRTRAHVARLGLNYKFDGSRPLLARY
jgi:outer membrane immunogenic protein